MARGILDFSSCDNVFSHCFPSRILATQRPPCTPASVPAAPRLFPQRSAQPFPRPPCACARPAPASLAPFFAVCILASSRALRAPARARARAGCDASLRGDASGIPWLVTFSCRSAGIRHLASSLASVRARGVSARLAAPFHRARGNAAPRARDGCPPCAAMARQSIALLFAGFPLPLWRRGALKGAFAAGRALQFSTRRPSTLPAAPRTRCAALAALCFSLVHLFACALLILSARNHPALLLRRRLFAPPRAAPPCARSIPRAAAACSGPARLLSFAALFCRTSFVLALSTRRAGGLRG